MTYTIISTNEYENLYLQTTTSVVSAYGENDLINSSIATYSSHDHHGCLDQNLLTTPVYINISILSGCPPGFRFDKDVGCICFQM